MGYFLFTEVGSILKIQLLKNKKNCAELGPWN